MPLTDAFLRTLKADAGPKKHFDGRGLYLEIKSTGTRVWRMKYRYAGKEKRLSLGHYPEVSLKSARASLDAARALLRYGVDPSADRKTARAAAEGRDSFEVVAREWLAGQEGVWAPSHAKRALSLLENDIFPYLGARALGDITSPELLIVIRRVERRALERAHRALQSCGQVFRYGVATGRCERNTAADLKGSLPPHKGGHFAAPTEPKDLRPILQRLEGYRGRGTNVVAAALRLAPLVFVRPGELRKARWEDIDFDTAEWRYVSSKTKKPHIVPLSRQAIAILREIQPQSARSAYVFPSERSSKRPMSDNAILAAMRRLEIRKDELTTHGLRATARTILDEVLKFRPDIIEHQLAHAVKDPNGRAYNRTAHLEARREMMQQWSDYLTELMKQGEVIQFPKAG